MELSEVKRNLNQKVIYHSRDFGNREMILTACILRKDRKNRFFYQAEIQDLKAKHSLTFCSLDKISALQDTERRKAYDRNG